MQIRGTVPSDQVNERTLGAWLEANTETAQQQIERGLVPPLADAINDGVRWKPEPYPPGQESFDLPTDVFRRGWGDCDDLGPWWAGELRASGVDPDAKAIVYKSAPTRWHVVVERSDGTIEDPSRWAGMGGAPILSGIPKTRPLSRSKNPTLAVGNAGRGLRRARLDVPLVGGNGVAVSCIGETDIDAIVGALQSTAALAFWGAADDVLARLSQCSSIMRSGVVGALLGDDMPPTLEDWERGHPSCPPGQDWSYRGGRFVCQPTSPILGAATASVDLGTLADIASTFIPGLGLAKLAEPMAQQFLKGATITASTRQQTSGAGPTRSKRPQQQKGTAPRGTGRGGRQQPQDPSEYGDPSQQYGGYGDPSQYGGYDMYGMQPGYGYPQQQGQFPSWDPYGYYTMMAMYGGGYGATSPQFGATPYTAYPAAGAIPYGAPYGGYGYGVQPGYSPQQYSYPAAGLTPVY